MANEESVILQAMRSGRVKETLEPYAIFVIQGQQRESHMELSGLDRWLPSKPRQAFLLVTLAAKQRRLRMSFVKIRPFYGRQDGSDDPDFHAEEIDYAIRKDDHTKADDIERDKIVLFRLYLKDSAG